MNNKEKSKVELKPMTMDGLVELHIQDIRSSKEPINLSLVRKAEICRSVYKRNEKTYLANGIDWSETGEKSLKDIDVAIIDLRALEVTTIISDNPDKRIGGTVTRRITPPVDGSSTILLTDFTEDILSLTSVPKVSIKVRLERDVIGVSPIEEEK